MRVTATKISAQQNLQYIFEGEDGLLDMDIVNNDPWALAQREGITILSNKDLYASVVDMDEGIVVGALFTSVDSFDGGMDYSFDTVVDKRYQNQGIGRELIKIGMNNYEELKDAYGDELVLMLDVVNEGIVPHLEREYGLHVLERDGGHFIMGSYT